MCSKREKSQAGGDIAGRVNESMFLSESKGIKIDLDLSSTYMNAPSFSPCQTSRKYVGMNISVENVPSEVLSITYSFPKAPVFFMYI